MIKKEAIDPEKEELKKLFLVEAKNRIKEIEQALLRLKKNPKDKESFKTIRNSAHSLEGNTLVLGEYEAGYFANKLDQIAETENINLITQLFESLKSALESGGDPSPFRKAKQIRQTREIVEKLDEVEKERERTEERYMNLTENMKELVYIAEPKNFVASFVNKAVLDIYGYPPEEWLKNPKLWDKTIHPECKERVFAEMSEAQKKGQNIIMEYRIIDKNKKIKWVQDHLTWIKDGSGKIVSLQGIVLDITEQKKFEEELKKSQEHLNMAQEVANIGSWDWDVKDNILTWSDKTFKQFGLKPGEIKPTFEAFSKFVHPDDLDRVNKEVKMALDGKKPYSTDFRVISKNKREWVMHSQGIVYRDKQGKPIRFVGTQQDITKQKKIKEKQNATKTTRP